MGLKNAVLFALFGTAAARSAPSGGGRELLGATWHQHTVSAGTCLDGNPGAYFINPGTNGDLVVYLQGVQYCTSDDNCFSKIAGQQGHAPDATVTYEMYQDQDSHPWYQGESLFSEEAHNDSTKVYMLGCDWSAFTSSGGEHHTADGSVHYNGRALLEGMVADLNAENMLGWGNVLVASASTAQSAVLNADYLSGAIVHHGEFKAWQDGGFVMDGLSIDDGLKTMFDTWGSGSVLSQDCQKGQKHGDAWKCLHGAFMAQYVATPTFFSGSKWDVMIPWMMPSIQVDGFMPCVNDPSTPGLACAIVYAGRQQFAQRIVKQLGFIHVMAPQHGFYFANCIAHAWSGHSNLVGYRYWNTGVSGHTLQSALGDFLGGHEVNVVDYSSGYTPSRGNYCEETPQTGGDSITMDSSFRHPFSLIEFSGKGMQGMH